MPIIGACADARAFIGPIAYRLVTLATMGNHRIAILGTGFLLALRLWLLRRVDMQRGMAASGVATQDPVGRHGAG